METATEVWMPLFAHFTATTGMRRVNGNTCPWAKWLEIAILNQPAANFLNYAAKFMPQRER